MSSLPSNVRVADAASRVDDTKERLASYARTLDCVHCGLCISSCPTYEVTGRESDSPRGRIYALRGWLEGVQVMSPAVEASLDRCIVCRGCETVCPSGIHMGDMMESFREARLEDRSELGIGRRFGRFLLRELVPFRHRIATLSDLVWLWDFTRLGRVADTVLARVSPRLAFLHRLRPRLARPSLRRVPTGVFRARSPVEGSRSPPRLRVGLFLGCIASDWFAHVHRATIRVLTRNGCDVVVPAEQSCCGALHRHAGELADSASLRDGAFATFRAAGVDLVVSNSAGCGAALKDSLPGADSRSRESELPVRDVCELLDEIGLVPPRTEVELRVAYDAPCHLEHGQRVSQACVERLLAQVPGIEIARLPESDLCCGAGGVYNVLHTDIAMELGARKAAAIRRLGVDAVVTGNPGCAMQIRASLDDDAVEVLHPIELIDRGYA